MIGFYRRFWVLPVALALTGMACAATDTGPLRTTSLGQVVGSDDHAGRHLRLEGHPVRARRRSANCAGRHLQSPHLDLAARPRSSSAMPAHRSAACTARARTTSTTPPSVPPSARPVGSEDCLYLNIWRPTTASANLPVIVFVHGGSNVSGYTADPVYDGAALARPPTPWSSR
jgi:para-nitrobenzyl esterase